MPRKLFLPEWVMAAAFLLAVIASVITDTEWLMFAFILLLLCQGIYAFILVRCPTCNGRLKFHKDYFHGRLDYRIQFTCTRCLVTWDTGKLGSDDTH
jgi:hypothetical protein